MVNRNEKEIINRYEAQGWKTLRGGAPDFIFTKVENGELKDFVFVEVKTTSDKLSYEQKIYGKILGLLGAKYKVEVIKPNHSGSARSGPEQSTPAQSVPFQSIPLEPISHKSWVELLHEIEAEARAEVEAEVKSNQTTPDQPAPLRATPTHATPGHPSPDHSMPPQTEPTHAIPRHTLPIRTNPAQTKPFQRGVNNYGNES